uniref:Si:ch211-203k16.3 n=1 Tax=Takifugu rubripes TaxID=31033 RepID=H2UBC1_TAKRU
MTMALSPSCVPSDVQHVRSCPIDCASIYYNGVRRSGLYTIVPSLAAMPLEVYCDMDTDGGGWTVIQRRVDGSVSFDRNWRDYRDGFGDLHSEFWLGNEHIHELSAQGEYSLRIHLEDWSNKHKHALYQRFSVEDEEHQYRLHVSGFTGTVQDSFSWYHDEQSFSTPDSGNICAEISHSGWWYNQCFYANLNGFYYRVNVHKQHRQLGLLLVAESQHDDPASQLSSPYVTLNRA